LLSDYQRFALSQIGLAAIGATSAFLIYFIGSKASGLANRFRTSAHAALLLVASLYAVFVAPYSASLVFAWLLPFWILMVIFVVSLIYGIAAFEGSRWIHAFQLIEIPCAFWILLVGTMTIGHDGP